MAVSNRRALVYYLIVCAHNEHFLDYRRTIRDDLEQRLRDTPSDRADSVAPPDHVAAAV